MTALSNYVPQIDDAEKVWVTVWINGSPKFAGRQISKGFMRRLRLWATDKNLDLIITEER